MRGASSCEFKKGSTTTGFTLSISVQLIDKGSATPILRRGDRSDGHAKRRRRPRNRPESTAHEYDEDPDPTENSRFAVRVEVAGRAAAEVDAARRRRFPSVKSGVTDTAAPSRVYGLIDLFAGCGGMTAGFVATNRFRPAFAVEWDQDAAETYGLNFGADHVCARAIEDVASYPPADVVVGGPPCQAFSLLNRGRVGPERRELWREYVHALDVAEPRLFIMENVPQLLGSPEFEEFKTEVEKRGWSVRADVLNAADFGVPQRRLRAIVIGTRFGGGYPWPRQTHWADGTIRPVDAPTWRTFADAVEGLPVTPDGRDWHRSRNPRDASKIRYGAVPLNGGNRFQMQDNLDRQGLGHLVPRCWRNKPSGTTDVFGRLRWDQPAYTIRTEFYKPEKGRYLHPTEHRPITVREAACCMSFPRAFRFPEHQSMTSVGRQIGNAVPPLLAQRVADAAAMHLDAADPATKCGQRVA
jgi:DNA (cytosine-5)-methyltransferase 1